MKNLIFLLLRRLKIFNLRNFLKNSLEEKTFLLVFIALIITIVIGFFSIKYAKDSIYLSRESLALQKEQQRPFFKYKYDKENKLFYIDGGEQIAVTKADWVFPSSISDNGYSLMDVNWLDIYLSWYELRDFFGTEMNLNILQEWGKDIVKCVFFQEVQDGVPAEVSITYDTKNESGLVVNELVLITRLDTEQPNVQTKYRNVTDQSKIEDFFNEHLRYLKMVEDSVRERFPNHNENYSGDWKDSTGKCKATVNQPMGGY